RHTPRTDTTRRATTTGRSANGRGRAAAGVQRRGAGAVAPRPEQHRAPRQEAGRRAAAPRLLHPDRAQAGVVSVARWPCRYPIAPVKNFARSFWVANREITGN